MKHKIYKGGVDNYPLWWYGQSTRLQNFGDRTNFLTPHGTVFQGNGYYFNGANSASMEDIYGRHLIGEDTNGLWSQLWLTDSAVPPCGSAVGTGNRLVLYSIPELKIAGKIILLPAYCPNLTHFICYYNHISILDVSRILTLTLLRCYGNWLSTLDVTNLVLLYKLDCTSNTISILDVSKMSLLQYLDCSNNNIPFLDVSNDSKIASLYCQHNQMDQSAVDKVLCDANAWNTSDGTLDISGNTAPSSTGTDCANDMVNRNWTVTTD